MLEKLLDKTIEKSASDLHLIIGRPPTIRIDGSLTELKNFKSVSKKDMDGMLSKMLNVDQRSLLGDNKELDFAYKHGSKGRFRINAFQQNGDIALALRLIPSKIGTFSELGLPDELQDIVNNQQGLFLAVGPAGHGKSTTIASMLDYINKNRTDHIITIEDPIEYVIEPKKCLVAQREIYSDALSFSRALKSALRQDPDVVFVGEMRDLETISTTLTIAETGHMVFSTLHTNSASETIDRLIDVFPPHQQGQIRNQIASSLKGIISLRLVPQIDGGRVLAWELLKNNSAVQNIIREGKTFQINNVIQTSMSDGMIPLDQSLANLVQDKKITAQDALFYAHDPKYLQKLIGG